MRSQSDINFVQAYQNMKTRYQSLQNMTCGLTQCTKDMRKLLETIPDKENQQGQTNHDSSEQPLKYVAHG